MYNYPYLVPGTCTLFPLVSEARWPVESAVPAGRFLVARMTALKFISGCFMAVLSGAFVALSMCVNRYSFAHANAFRSSCGCMVHPWMWWLLGMFLYNVGAVAFYSIANLLIPLVLVACLFVTLLVINLIIARLWLREEITPPKIVGALLIVCGATMAGVGTPTENASLQETYTCFDGHVCVHEHVSELARRPVAVVWNVALFVATIFGIVCILTMEWFYPARDIRRAAKAGQAATTRNSAPSAAYSVPLDNTTAGDQVEAFSEGACTEKLTAEAELDSAAATPAAAPAAAAPVAAAAAAAAGGSKGAGMEAVATKAVTAESVTADKAADKAAVAAPRCCAWLRRFVQLQFGEDVYEARPPSLAPPWLESIMAFVYPASLACDEGIAHMWLRAETAMTTQCPVAGCGHPIFFISVAMRWGCSLITGFWLIVVFRRYQTTLALPIEYGVVTALDVISGLVFYNEHRAMAGWQLALVASGCVLCILGVVVGLLDEWAPGITIRAVRKSCLEGTASRHDAPIA